MEGIIIALISLVSTIVLAVLQFRKENSEANKNDSEAVTNLVDVALKVSKQETDTLRSLCEDLKQENHELKEENQLLKEKLKQLEGG